MKRRYTHTEVPNPLLVLRKAGYSPFTDPQTGEESFVIRLTSEFYPRFHLYVEHWKDGVEFNLHLDQKKPSYGGHAHAGEYEGSTVEKEMERIDSWVKAFAYSAEHPVIEPTPVIKKTSWWRNLFFGG